jgi:hypothetical protein
MVMHVIGITLEKFVKEHVEREPVSIFEQQVVSLKIRLVVHSIIHNSFASKTL